MFKCDYHTHTYFSFDGDKASSPDALCESAIRHGVTDLAITDHFECNYKTDAIAPPYNALSAYEAIMASKEKYKNKLNLTYGIEMGQANQCPNEAKELLDSFPFEFVIASIHNLRGSPDFYYYDFTKIDSDEYISQLFERNITELCESIDALNKIDTVAHITYIHRYLALANKTYDFKNNSSSLERLFYKMIKRDIALEINVSTMWRGLGFTMPNSEIISIYRDCGGNLVTVGTDSHSPSHIGDCIENAFSLLKSTGLNNILTVKNGEKNIEKI